jgi:hypothetical protein
MKLDSCNSLTILLSACVLLSNCAAPAGPPKLPESASFGWKLKDIAETKADAAPDVVRTAGVTRSWRAEYSGPGVANVDVYALKSEAAGLAITQNWRASADTVTVFNAHYFVVIHWQATDRAAATALVGQIERSLVKSE